MLIKKEKVYVDARTLCTENEVDSIIPLHVITSSDHTSSYYGIRNKSVADWVNKSAEAKDLLALCGSSVELTPQITQNMTTFVTKYVYNDKVSSTPSEARVLKWRKQKKKSLSRMIPDSDSLLHHFKRVNYMCYIQKNFKLREHPSPLLHGWYLEDGLCLPIRHSLPALPTVMPEHDQDSSSDESDSEESETDDDSQESCGSDDYSDSD